MWGKIDQEWARNRKIRRASMPAKVLWVTAFAESNRAGANGVVEDIVAEDAALLARIDDHEAVIAELVELELWHPADEAKKCGLCREELKGRKLPQGSWYFHGWRKCNLTKEELTDPQERFTAARKKALHNNRTLVDLVYERDGDECRYCGGRYEKTKAHNKPLSRQIDHVDPDGPNELWNLASSHKVCNGRKGHHFPWERGMFLRPPAYPHGRDGTRPRIPDATYEGQNAALKCDPATGLPWGQPPGQLRVNPDANPGPTEGQPDGQHDADPVVDLPSRARATRSRVGSVSAPGRPHGQPGVNPGSTPGSTHANGTDGLSPDGDGGQVVRLPQQPPGGDVA